MARNVPTILLRTFGNTRWINCSFVQAPQISSLHGQERANDIVANFWKHSLDKLQLRHRARSAAAERVQLPQESVEPESMVQRKDHINFVTGAHRKHERARSFELRVPRRRGELEEEVDPAGLPAEAVPEFFAS